MRAHYDVASFCTGQIGKTSMHNNILSRIQNDLVATINTKTLLPKAIVLIFEDDILDAVDHYKIGASNAIGWVLEWLANQIHRIIVSHKEKLPSKSRIFKYPTVLWTLIPLHTIYGHYNDFKEKFNNSVKQVTGLSTLTLYAWDPKELDYFSDGCINGNGLTTYWLAVNQAFEAWDKEQMKMQHSNQLQGHSTSQCKSAPNHNKNHFRKNLDGGRHWHRQHRNDRFHWHAKDTRFTLPSLKDSRRFDRHH